MKLFSPANKGPYSIVIKVLICAIFWYQALIQNYFYIPGFLPFLGVAVLVTIFLDCNGMLARFLRYPTKSLYMMFFYSVLTVFFGFFVSPDIRNQFSQSIYVLEFLLVAFCICYYVGTRGSYDFLIKNSILLFGVILLIFLLAPEQTSHFDEFDRLSIQNVNPNSLAIEFSLFVWALLHEVNKKKIHSLIALPLVCLALYGCFLTGSRKGFISLGLVLLCWLIFVFLPDRSRPFALRLSILLVICAVGFFIVRPLFLSSALLTRLKDFTDQGTQSRFRMYQFGWDYLYTSPLFGYGFGGFSYLYGAYSHSSFIEVFVSSGIPLGFLYFSSYVVLFTELMKKRKRLIRSGAWSSESKNELLMVLILLLTLVVSFFYLTHIYLIISYYILSILFAWIIKPERSEFTNDFLPPRNSARLQPARPAPLDAGSCEYPPDVQAPARQEAEPSDAGEL